MNIPAFDIYRKKQTDAAVKRFEEKKPSCLYCRKRFSYEKRNNKFCNASCAAKYNNTRRTSRKKIRYCLYCGKEIEKYGNKFCNQVCFQALVWKNYKKEVFEKGIFPRKDGNSSCRVPKKFLIETRGHKCEICKTEIWMGKSVPLVFDHIDGDASNWKLSNCRIVCGNCDMQLPTYKNKNKKSARTKRYASVAQKD